MTAASLVRRAGDAVMSLAVVAATTAVAHAFGANPATVGFVYLIAVLAVAVPRGLFAGVVASLAATACFNYFFLPTVGSWTIVDPANWVALSAFLIASVVATRLVARAQRRASDAEAREKQVQALYDVSLALAAERERSLTQRAHLDALRESDALKTSLLRAVSHDLRTPITAIRLGLERLQRDGGDASRTAVENVSREIERLSRRIDNLLAMARLDAGTFAPHPEPFPPADLFRAALESLPLVLNDRRVDVSVAPDTPDLFVDPSLGVEILVNLLENAARLAPPSEPLGLHAEESERGAGRVRLDVLDRGPGVPASARKSDAGRSGLGLEICRSLAHALGGSVALLDRPGGGTIARVELPAARLAPSEAAA